MTDVQDAEVVETGIVPAPQGAIAIQDELSVDQVLAQVKKIQAVMGKAMKKDEHYGTIPGTDKPTLYKPGAEKLCLTFRLAPTYPDKRETWHGNGHYTVAVTCRLVHIATGNLIAEGEGLCSTLESKYAHRNASRVCPHCEKDAIIKGKQEYGGGWVCFKKKDGCGAKFSDGDPSIESQQVGKIDNPDLADSYNTVLKMACKRALIAAVLNGTAASDIFTQDIGDPEVAEAVTTPDSGAPTPSGKTEPQAAEASPPVSPSSEEETGGGTPSPAPSTSLTPEQELDEKDRLFSLIERALEADRLNPDSLRAASFATATANGETAPAQYDQLRNLSLKSLSEIVAGLKLEEKVSA